MDGLAQPGWNPRLRPRLRITFTMTTLVAAVPLWLTSAWFAQAALRVVVDPQHRVTDGLRGLADWPWVEALAWLFSVVLPLSVLLARGLHHLAPRWPFAETGTAAAVLAVLTLLVWRLFAAVPGAGWFVVGFLFLAGARWLAHAAARRSTEEQFEALRRAKAAFVKLYGAGTLGFLLCGATCVPLLALAGPKLDADARQTMLVVLLGAWYFALVGALEIVRIETGAAPTPVPMRTAPRRAAGERHPAMR